MELSALFEITKSSFAHLQAQGKRCHYPDNLKEDALKLLSHYPEPTLCAALGITHTSLRNWRKDKNQQENPSPTFMRLSLDEQPSILTSVVDKSTPLTLHLPHRLSLSLPEQSVKKTAQFVCALIKEFDQCSI